MADKQEFTILVSRPGYEMERATVTFNDEPGEFVRVHLYHNNRQVADLQILTVKATRRREVQGNG